MCVCDLFNSQRERERERENVRACASSLNRNRRVELGLNKLVLQSKTIGVSSQCTPASVLRYQEFLNKGTQGPKVSCWCTGRIVRIQSRSFLPSKCDSYFISSGRRPTSSPSFCYRVYKSSSDVVGFLLLLFFCGWLLCTWLVSMSFGRFSLLEPTWVSTVYARRCCERARFCVEVF